MDKTIRRKTRTAARGGAGPVVALADWYQFGPGERADRPCVESRMLLWCDAGRGYLSINGIESAFLPGEWVLLPWRHSIVYQADSRDPFLVGGVHLIPHHEANRTVVFRIAHRKADPLAGDPGRRDAKWPGLEGIVHRRFSGNRDSLALLARYTIERFQQATPQRAIMTQLAILLVEEMTQSAQRQPRSDELVPTITLQRIQAYAQTHIARQLSMEELAGSASCSEASVYRLFREHVQTTPGRWLRRLKMERAANLLRTSTLAVSEIGERVGFSDPFHFSRVFKLERGVSPRMYRDRQVIL